jgi:LPXTG-motif cell wall-anchored protein
VKGQTLPFTGYSLVWTTVGGLVLLIAGFGLRRREQRR